jgi:putative addiction module component (TIGR02574 family)
MDSLDAEADEDVQAAWDTEVRKRIAELDSGKVKPIPWEKARQIILGLPDGPPRS